MAEKGYDPHDRDAAWEKANEWGDRIPLGVIYQEEGRPTYEEQLEELREGPLFRQPLEQDRSVLDAIKAEFL